MKLDYLGHEYRDFNFEMNDVAVESACMSELNGEHYIFGGNSGRNYQMAKTDGCGLQRLPDLDFTFSQGSCYRVKELTFSRNLSRMASI